MTWFSSTFLSCIIIVFTLSLVWSVCIHFYGSSQPQFDYIPKFPVPYIIIIKIFILISSLNKISEYKHLTQHLRVLVTILLFLTQYFCNWIIFILQILWRPVESWEILEWMCRGQVKSLVNVYCLTWPWLCQGPPMHHTHGSTKAFPQGEVQVDDKTFLWCECQSWWYCKN